MIQFYFLIPALGKGLYLIYNNIHAAGLLSLDNANQHPRIQMSYLVVHALSCFSHTVDPPFLGVDGDRSLRVQVQR